MFTRVHRVAFLMTKCRIILESDSDLNGKSEVGHKCLNDFYSGYKRRDTANVAVWPAGIIKNVEMIYLVNTKY